MNFKPLGKRVLVDVHPKKEKTNTGIYIPDSAAEQFSIATVISMGEEATSVKQGDKVMFSSGVGADIEVDGKNYRLIPDEAYIEAII